tara:strand:+ start:1469 stop:1723 length:255 start_codon:yes stop_codon:yes gene_type:complete
MAIDFSFNLFEENDFNSIFPEPRNGKESLQRDLFRQLMRSELMRSDCLANRSGRLNEEMIKFTKEKIEALVIALTALKNEENAA